MLYQLFYFKGLFSLTDKMKQHHRWLSCGASYITESPVPWHCCVTAEADICSSLKLIQLFTTNCSSTFIFSSLTASYQTSFRGGIGLKGAISSHYERQRTCVHGFLALWLLLLALAQILSCAANSGLSGREARKEWEKCIKRQQRMKKRGL